jgi:hypothetical protein
MKIKYLFVIIAIVLALIVIGPVSAYSISVSGMNGGRGITSTIQSYPNRIHTTSYVPSNSMDIPIASGTNSNGSGGSVSAFSKGKYEDPTTFIEFGQSVSVTGVIKDFSYSARYDSSVFR